MILKKSKNWGEKKEEKILDIMEKEKYAIIIHLLVKLPGC